MFGFAMEETCSKVNTKSLK